MEFVWVSALLIAVFRNQLSGIGDFVYNTVLTQLSFTKKGIKRLNNRNLRVFAKTYRNDSAVTMHIIRKYFFASLFLGTVGLYSIFVLLGPLNEISKLPESLQQLIYSPIYIFEALWLKQSEFVNALIRVRGERCK